MIAGAASAASLVAGVAFAQSPPVPDFYRPYGRVQLDGANIAPEVQPVVAFVHGQPCGSGSTFVPESGPDTPAEDEGKTVYVLDVLAAGTGASQAPGCGDPGDPVLLYFPLLGRYAVEVLAFQQGEERANVTLGSPFATRLPLPFVSNDGASQ